MRNEYTIDCSDDRLDKDFYLVLEDFRSGPAFRETDESVTYIALIDDLLTGQYDQVQRIVAFNPVEGWSRDASEDVAGALEAHGCGTSLKGSWGASSASCLSYEAVSQRSVRG